MRRADLGEHGVEASAHGVRIDLWRAAHRRGFAEEVALAGVQPNRSGALDVMARASYVSEGSGH